MQALAMLDGLWRGPATAYQPGGGTIPMTQTERSGSFLGGTLKVVEGRGLQMRLQRLGDTRWPEGGAVLSR